MKRTLFLMALLSSLATGCGNDYYLMNEVDTLDERGDWVPLTDGCQLFPRGGSGSEGGLVDIGQQDDPDFFALSSSGSDGELLVTISTSMEDVQRKFDLDFARDEEEEVVDVTAGDGTVYRIKFYGGSECINRPHWTYENDGPGGASGGE